MPFIAYAGPAGTIQHPSIFYVVIAIVGVALVAGIVVSLLMLVLRNIDREWPSAEPPRGPRRRTRTP